MPSPRLHVLPWSQPLIHSVVAWLARGWQGGSPLDLRDALVVLPTAQSERRLREALASHAATFQQAVFPPRVLMPIQLTVPETPAAGTATASTSELLLAWAHTLREIDFDRYREVFPIDPPGRTFSWAVRLAQDLISLQSMLAENGLRIGDVVAQAGEDFPEVERWRQLGRLEAACETVLTRQGLRDPQRVKIAFARRPVPLEGVTRIIVAGTPDPLPLAMQVLSAYAEAGLPVTVLVAGPDADAEAAPLFDAWGRPAVDAWVKRAFSPADFEQRVRLCADPAAQAELIAACAVEYASPAGRLDVGVADAEVVPSLEHALARAGVRAFNPDGRSMRGGTLHTLLTALSALVVREPTFAGVAALLRCPDVLAWLGGSPVALLAALDDFQAKHLPPTLAAARGRVRPGALAKALDAMARLQVTLMTEAFPQNVRAVLTEIFKERSFDQTRPEDVRTIESAQAWNGVLSELEAALQRLPGLAAVEVWELALRMLGECRRFDDKPEGAVELQGWLELLWDDVPHLIVAGMNDGNVPDAVVGHAFLPEGLRVRLGLKTNAARFARDAYLLQALAAMRTDGRGRLDLLVGKTSGAGDPLRPSRLLLQCADAELPARVAFLFSPAGSGRANPAWRRAWKLKPRTDAKIESLSVTSFRDYLKCPFRFYLKRGLKMQPFNAHKAELDEMDFGTLCHAALEAMGKPDSPVRDSTDAGLLREFLLGQLEQTAAEWYGASPVLPVVVQLESARQRLSKVAEVQAQLRAEGWVIERTEWAFNIVIGDLPVRGKIDRIDRNELTGEVRVIDYKTSDKPVNPADAHLRGPKRNEDVGALPEWAQFTLAGDDALWVDLQLPLYLEAVAEEFGHAVVCGYFNLPKATGETGVSLWSGYTSEVQAAARCCAEGVVAAVQARRFWPPVELPAEHDDFAVLFHEGAEASVEWPAEGGA